jgi:hypothetical protein
VYLRRKPGYNYSNKKIVCAITAPLPAITPNPKIAITLSLKHNCTANHDDKFLCSGIKECKNRAADLA